MRLTEGQRRAVRLMAEAYGMLSCHWSDELGEALKNLGLIPTHSIDEAECECFHIAENGEVPKSVRPL